MAAIFRDNVTPNEWMKGLLSSAEVIEEMGIQLRGRFRDDFLGRRLDLDCARMKVNVELFEILRVMRAEAMVVIATDNMDCFVRAFEKARTRRRRWEPDRETLADWAVICDDIICSSQSGALKSEDPQEFFGPWLDRHGVTFADAVLVDDRDDNCAAFVAHGGTAIRWKMGIHDISDAISQLKQWLDSRVQTH
jgi:FMN phosphatase YigB (HAD superfamily)